MTKVLQTAILSDRSGGKADAAGNLISDYITRTSRYTPCASQLFDSEAAFFTWLDRQAARTPAYLVLLDPRGRQLSSEELAQAIGKLRDSGTQRLVFAIGPADGWSESARSRANLLLSFGRITLPHQLARVVLAEQVYRAFTILAGHPYHSGH
ncbi:MAG: 23S rRNA (pseudouridine(1915)-N(3))-methyltransferase RlmH [Acidobacteria bacterium]|nr:23S rRNA (pseudouridine(1915)-N(3))-methyltransferase RlmH [Acidobacteriota bacterium]